MPFGRVLYIERDDFMENAAEEVLPPVAGQRSAASLRVFHQVHGRGERSSHGEIVELRATYDPATRGGDSPDGRKVKATLHWVSAAHALDAEVRLYDRLFNHEDPAANRQLSRSPESEVAGSLRAAKVEPGLATAAVGSRYQFERIGYFSVDPDSRPGALVFNRTVSLRDTWAKIAKKSGH